MSHPEYYESDWQVLQDIVDAAAASATEPDEIDNLMAPDFSGILSVHYDPNTDEYREVHDYGKTQ